MKMHIFFFEEIKVVDQMLLFKNYAISLDRNEPNASMHFVSHAHSDHISGARKSKRITASSETIDLINAVYGSDVHEESLSYDHAKIELLSAGHMLGSKQLFIEDYESGASFVYSGDFQMERSDTVSPIEIKKADIAIIDSTYPYPDVRFGSKEEVKESLANWVSKALEKGNVLFTAYRMGKAQELIKILNGNGIVPLVSKEIDKVNKVYIRHGIKLEYMSAYDETLDCEEAVKENFVGITDLRDIRRLAKAIEKVYAKRAYTAIATGFAKTVRFETDAQFALSDHADFSQAIAYLEEVQPRAVFTYGPNSVIMAANLEKAGYNAVPLSPNSSLNASIIARLNSSVGLARIHA